MSANTPTTCFLFISLDNLNQNSSFFFSFPFMQFFLDDSILIQRRQWHPTPVLLPGKSHGWRSLVGCRLWGHTKSDATSDGFLYLNYDYYHILLTSSLNQFSVNRTFFPNLNQETSHLKFSYHFPYCQILFTVFSVSDCTRAVFAETYGWTYFPFQRFQSLW